MDDLKKIIRENFSDEMPTECPKCGSGMRSLEQFKKIWYDKEDEEIKSGGFTATIQYWCGSSFTLGNGCKE